MDVKVLIEDINMNKNISVGKRMIACKSLGYN